MRRAFVEFFEATNRPLPTSDEWAWFYTIYNDHCQATLFDV